MINKNKILIVVFLLVFYFCNAQFIQAQENKNTGFIKENIWYSKDPFTEGDKIKIYTLIFNSDSKELSGTVIFFDKNVFLGKKNFIIPGNGVKDISVDWVVNAGDHTIFAKIENARLLIEKNKYQDIFLTQNETEKSNRTVAKKIISKNTEKNTDIKNNTEDIPINKNTDIVISNIAEKIRENTPEIISKPIIASVTAVDSLRENTTNNIKTERDQIKEKIQKYPKKPFEYVKLFFITLLYYLLAYKILFYLVLFTLIFLLARFIWRRIF